MFIQKLKRHSAPELESYFENSNDYLALKCSNGKDCCISSKRDNVFCCSTLDQDLLIDKGLLMTDKSVIRCLVIYNILIFVLVYIKIHCKAYKLILTDALLAKEL